MLEEKICPYPGLRPFNDDESIFFKGRDHNIEVIVELFEKKKFMMLTGASGDGKSSLVYAGVVPHARAGLFKAKYNNWAVADFRPERDPLGNLTQSLNRFFKFEGADVLRKELAYGFSSLIKIYKDSPLYIDPEGKKWQEADEAGKKQLRRKAANLLIIADQFEEFFTNTENYHNGIASVESQTTINLLLETAKIALAEDIPIYIICTMRSDYIGQCAAFRGLPEMIGFSQFFVPRLKRNQIAQVIEEPAQLNGDSISRRLSERLLNDITEGYDQLPILQHALNQIWKVAKNGEEEMDLFHYAKVGGLSKDQLPSEDKQKFEVWFEQLPAFKKQLFRNPSLENILNAHANELYETAHEKYLLNHGENAAIDNSDAKLIIKTAYQCLTKIDEARAVRNRMTQQEITDIISLPHITSSTVGKVLDIFREQGNTFIKPFITNDPATNHTHSETILDITHESLIRNWDLLGSWAKEEYDNWLNFQDFNKQLQRWVDSGKTKGYLLPIGPLTFFEKWFNTCKPNRYWLARYDERDVPVEQKLTDAETTLDNAREFIRKSANRLFFSRTVLRYGANKLITYLALFVMLCSCTYYYFDYKRKQNEYVLNEIKGRGLELLKSDKVRNKEKAKFINNCERLSFAKFETLLDSVHNDTMAYDIAYEDFFLVQNYDARDSVPTNPLLHRLLVYMDSSLDCAIRKSESRTIGLARNIKRIAGLNKLCAFIKYYKDSPAIKNVLNKYLAISTEYILESLNQPKDIRAEIFNVNLELLLALSDPPVSFIDSLLHIMSPFESVSNPVFNVVYPRDLTLKIDWNNVISHRGGYQILAYLFIAKKDFKNAERCLDSLLANNSEYKNFWNEGFYDLTDYGVKFGVFPSADFDPLVKKYLKASAKSENRFYADLVNRLNYQKLNAWLVSTGNSANGFNNSLIRYCILNEKSDKLWDYVADVTLKSRAGHSRDLEMALYFKKRGLFEAQTRKNRVVAEKYFGQAFALYKGLSPEFLDQDYTFYSSDGTVNVSASKLKNSVVFLYPTVVNDGGWNALWYWFTENIQNAHPFFDYITAHKLEFLYKSQDDFKALETFLYGYCFVSKYNLFYRSYTPFDYKYVDQIAAIESKQGGSKTGMFKSTLDLIALNKLFEKGDTTTAFQQFAVLDMKEITRPDFQQQDEFKSAVTIGLLKETALNLALLGKTSRAFSLIKILKDPWEKRNCLIDICYDLQSKGPVETTFLYLDSICRDIDQNPKFGMKLFTTLGLIGSQPIYYTAMNTFKDIDDKLKPRARNNFVRGIAMTGLYYKAFSYIPEFVSRVNELDLYNEILHAEILRKFEHYLDVAKDEKKLALTRQLLDVKRLVDAWGLYEKQFYGARIPENYEFQEEHFNRFSE